MGLSSPKPLNIDPEPIKYETKKRYSMPAETKKSYYQMGASPLSQNSKVKQLLSMIQKEQRGSSQGNAEA